MKTTRLPATWFQRDVLAVARDLIGKVLVHGERAGIITECEAYLGPEDLASHTRFGVTKRNAVMFGPGGVAYVYLCYGVHEMFNIVTGAEGDGQAILIRAIAPLRGLPDDPAIGRGPGKLTVALGLDRSHDRRDLGTGDVFVEDRGTRAPPISTGPRIGVAFAGPWAARPYRFWWTDHPSVTRTPKPAATAPSGSPRGAGAGGTARPTASSGRGSSRAGSARAKRR